jgi:signal transduction histidine kinase
MKLDPDTPAPREATTEDRGNLALRAPGTPGWAHLCETVRGLGRFDDVALAAVALVLDPAVGAQASAWCQIDGESDQLRGTEASMLQDRELVQSMPASEREEAGLLELLSRPRKARRAPGAPAALIRRVRFSLQDRTLGPVAAVGQTRSRPARGEAAASSEEIEHPLELAKILGEGRWTYWPVAHDGAPEAVLCLRDLPDNAESRAALDLLLAAAGSAACRIRLALQVKAQERRARALTEISHRILVASTLEDLLDAVARTAARTLDAPWAMIWTLSGPESALRLAAHCGQNPTDEAESRARLDQAARCVSDFRVRSLLDSRQQPIGTMVPLHAFETPLGAFAVAHGAADASSEETSRDRSFLEIVGALSSLALRNVELGAELRALGRRERELHSMLHQSERLAAIGETSAHLARQLELPLNAIGETAKALADAVPEEDPRAPQADLIAREARRLLALVREQVALMQLERPRLRNVDLSELAHEAFAMVRSGLERSGVQIEEQHEPNLPALLLDHDKVRQVILRVIEHVSGALVRGTRFSLRTVRQGPVVSVEIASESQPPDGGVVDSLFLPFGGETGAGLGLAVARQIILDHGGELEVSSDDSWPIRFRISFPIRENQDRRGQRSDRRTGRDRRRAA